MNQPLMVLLSSAAAATPGLFDRQAVDRLSGNSGMARRIHRHPSASRKLQPADNGFNGLWRTT